MLVSVPPVLEFFCTFSVYFSIQCTLNSPLARSFPVMIGRAVTIPYKDEWPLFLPVLSTENPMSKIPSCAGSKEIFTFSTAFLCLFCKQSESIGEGVFVTPVNFTSAWCQNYSTVNLKCLAPFNVRRSIKSPRKLTLDSCTSIEAGKRTSFWQGHLPPTRYGHTCKPGNEITEKLCKSQGYQPSESFVDLSNFPDLGYCLLHLKHRPVSSLKLEVINTQAPRGFWDSESSVSSADSRSTEASFRTLFFFLVNLLPVNLLFVSLPLLNFLGGIFLRRLNCQQWRGLDLQHLFLHVLAMEYPLTVHQGPVVQSPAVKLILNFDSSLITDQ